MRAILFNQLTPTVANLLLCPKRTLSREGACTPRVVASLSCGAVQA